MQGDPSECRCGACEKSVASEETGNFQQILVMGIPSRFLIIALCVVGVVVLVTAAGLACVYRVRVTPVHVLAL